MSVIMVELKWIQKNLEIDERNLKKNRECMKNGVFDAGFNAGPNLIYVEQCSEKNGILYGVILWFFVKECRIIKYDDLTVHKSLICHYFAWMNAKENIN